jgi:hypothetical protein
MNRRLTMKLIDPTPERWLKWKGLQNHLAEHAAKYNIELSDLVYDDEKFIKSVSYQAYSRCDFMNFSTETSYCMKSFDLTVDYLSSEDLAGTKDIIAQIKHSLKSNPS